MDRNSVIELVINYLGDDMAPWEKFYLEFHAQRFAETVDMLGPGNGQSLLDVGSFPGHLAVAALDLGYRVEALTGGETCESDNFIGSFTEKLAKHEIPVSLADVEADRWPYDDETFDIVLASEIIEHLPYNPYHALFEAYRVLKPGGRIIITTPNLAMLDKTMRLLSGQTIHQPLELPFHETFKSILIGRHIREYTADEITYMLEKQDKRVYRFRNTKVDFSMCLDPAFTKRGAPMWLAKRMFSRFRSTLMVEAQRPENFKLIPFTGAHCKGFHDVEEHAADMGSTGRILASKFRWTKKKSELILPSSGAKYQVFYFHTVFLAPDSLTPATCELKAGGQILGRYNLPPSLEFRMLRLALPAELAVDGKFHMEIESSTWRPSDHPGRSDYYEYSANDRRDLGIAFGWDGFMRENCHDFNALKDVAYREMCCKPLNEGNEPCWSHFFGLYLCQSDFGDTLTIGPGDWRQLGTGWYHLENWPERSVRWTGEVADAYLAPKQGAKQAVVQVFTGEQTLGESICGSLEVSWAPDRLAFNTLRKTDFTLPAETWTEVTADFPHSLAPQGLLRFELRVAQTRVPAELIPDNSDTRELGLVVAEMGTR